MDYLNTYQALWLSVHDAKVMLMYRALLFLEGREHSST